MLRLKVFVCDDSSMLEPSFNNWMNEREKLGDYVDVEGVNVVAKSNGGFVMLVTYKYKEPAVVKKTLKKITRKGTYR